MNSTNKHFAWFFCKSAILLFFFNSISLSLYSQTNYETLKNVASFRNKLDETSKNLNTIQCNFVQEKYLSVLSNKIKSSGDFYFKKENLLRWEYKKPYSYIIVINGSTIKIKDDKKLNSYDSQSNKLFQKINEMMVSAIQGTILNNKQFNSEYYENNQLYCIKLFPNTDDLKKMFTTILVYFDKKDYSVVKLKLLESGNDYTLIEFKNKKINNNIANEIFTIK